MLQSLKHMYKEKIVIIAALAGLAAIVGLTIAPTATVNAEKTEKRHCRVQTISKEAWYEADVAVSAEKTVPKSKKSECLDINIRNVKNTDPTIKASDPDKYCAYFKVAMYKGNAKEPTYYSKEKRVCSKDPSTSSSKIDGPVIPIATDVINGTRYRVHVETTDTKKPVTYQLVD